MDKNFVDTYQAHVKGIYRFALFKTNSYQDAEDITAEVFLQYLRKGGGLKQETVLSWLYAVAGNLCVNHYRKKGRAERLTPMPENRTEQCEPWQDSHIWGYVKKLSLREQQIIYLRAIEDKTFKEAAAILNEKEGTVKMVYYRAIGNLRGLRKEAVHD